MLPFVILGFVVKPLQLRGDCFEMLILCWRNSLSVAIFIHYHYSFTIGLAFADSIKGLTTIEASSCVIEGSAWPISVHCCCLVTLLLSPINQTYILAFNWTGLVWICSSQFLILKFRKMSFLFVAFFIFVS